MSVKQWRRDASVPRSDSDTWPVGQHPYANETSDEGCGLPLSVRRRVREVHARLDMLEDYEVLDVAPDADGPTLIRAYCDLVDEIHPSRYPGVALGDYGVKMEMVVARATAAYYAIAQRASKPEPAVQPMPVSEIPPSGTSLAPIPPEVSLAQEVASLIASAMLAERAFDWEAAAVQYECAYGLRADAMTAARAGRAILRASGDLKKAAKLAEDASAKEPRNADYHVLRGMIYREAGLFHCATEACAHALECEPTHPRAKELHAKLKARLDVS